MVRFNWEFDRDEMPIDNKLISNIRACYIGSFEKGECDKFVYINSVANFVKIFGNPTDKTVDDYKIIQDFFEHEGVSLFVMRVIDYSSSPVSPSLNYHYTKNSCLIIGTDGFVYPSFSTADDDIIIKNHDNFKNKYLTNSIHQYPDELIRFYSRTPQPKMYNIMMLTSSVLDSTPIPNTTKMVDSLFDQIYDDEDLVYLVVLDLYENVLERHIISIDPDRQNDDFENIFIDEWLMNHSEYIYSVYNTHITIEEFPVSYTYLPTSTGVVIPFSSYDSDLNIDVYDTHEIINNFQTDVNNIFEQISDLDINFVIEPFQSSTRTLNLNIKTDLFNQNIPIVFDTRSIIKYDEDSKQVYLVKTLTTAGTWSLDTNRFGVDTNIEMKILAYFVGNDSNDMMIVEAKTGFESETQILQTEGVGSSTAVDIEVDNIFDENDAVKNRQHIQNQLSALEIDAIKLLAIPNFYELSTKDYLRQYKFGLNDSNTSVFMAENKFEDDKVFSILGDLAGLFCTNDFHTNNVKYKQLNFKPDERDENELPKYLNKLDFNIIGMDTTTMSQTIKPNRFLILAFYLSKFKSNARFILKDLIFDNNRIKNLVNSKNKISQLIWDTIGDETDIISNIDFNFIIEAEDTVRIVFELKFYNFIGLIHFDIIKRMDN